MRTMDMKYSMMNHHQVIKSVEKKIRAVPINSTGPGNGILRIICSTTTLVLGVKKKVVTNTNERKKIY